MIAFATDSESAPDAFDPSSGFEFLKLSALTPEQIHHIETGLIHHFGMTLHRTDAGYVITMRTQGVCTVVPATGIVMDLWNAADHMERTMQND